MTGAVFAPVLAWLLALGLGLAARRGLLMDYEQWVVGKRALGGLFVFVLLAGELYTTFTLLGASGWAERYGAPAFYIIAYGTLAYVVGFWLLPPLWRYGRRHGLVSERDFFTHRYRSPRLARLVAWVGLLAMFPYLVLQLRALGLIVSVTSSDAIGARAAIVAASAALVLYVAASGLRSSTWTALVKDGLLLGLIGTLAVVLPARLAGGIGSLVRELMIRDPRLFVLPARGYDPAWFVTTVLLSALGFFLWPHTFPAIFSARSEDALRRSTIVLPLYQLLLVAVFVLGFTARAVDPGLRHHDRALLTLVMRTTPAWTAALLGAAGVLTALVPAALLLLTIGSVLAAEIGGKGGKARITAMGRARLAVVIVTLLAATVALRSLHGIVFLLLLGYSYVTQLLPATISGLCSRPWFGTAGAEAGILTGVTVVSFALLAPAAWTTVLTSVAPVLRSWNVGFLALVLNVLVAFVVGHFRKDASRLAAPPAEGA
jgi:SSS family solute:Na+ symporter